MRSSIILLLYCFFITTCFGQATYTSTNFAASTDTFYLTKANIGNYNFDTTGANITWNYSGLTGNSQRRLYYRLPTQTGFSFVQWPYINNSSNVNLSSTDEQTIAVLGLQETNPNDYYLKNSNYLMERASSFTVVINNSSFNVKNVYNNPDTIYKFPFTYNSVNSSRGAYSIAIPPDLYYRNVKLNRKDTVNGWGTLITPFGTFSNCLKYVSTVTEIDSSSVNGNPIAGNDTSYYREIKWFDLSKKNPVLSVRENKFGSQYVTQTIEYLDAQQFYQPVALFTYLPLSPNMGDTVTFQNLTSNGYVYKWHFGDSSSNANDSSTAINPQHIFTNAGSYHVQLIAYNGPLTDTFALNINVNPLNVTYTFNGNGNWSDAVNWSNNMVPPANLNATNSIVINPSSGGQCVLNISQTIQSGASLTVSAGKTLVIPGMLKLQ